MKKIADRTPAASILALILILILLAPVLAQSEDPASLKPVVLTDEQGEYPLGLSLEILKDPGGELTIKDVSSPAYHSTFVPSQVSVPNFGYVKGAYWIRFQLKNNTSKIDRWLLELGFPNMHYADLYLPTESGGWIAKQSGVLRPFEGHDVVDRHLIFELPLPAQTQQTYYMRFQNGGSMTIPLVLWNPEGFYKENRTEQFYFGLFYGALLIMLFYNLFVLYSLRDASHLYYVCFLGSLILWSLTNDGIAPAYLWPRFYWLNSFVIRSFYILTMAFILMFTDSFLDLKTRHPRLHRSVLFLVAGWGIAFILVPLLSYFVMVIIVIPLGIITITLAAVTGLISWRMGFLPARFFLFSWMGFFIGGLLILFVREGILQSTAISENLFRLGILWLATFWSISLTDRVNLLKAETESANRALRLSEHRLSQILEGLPLGVVVYGKDRRPSYGNKRTFDILTNPKRNIRPDVSAGRTLETAIQYYDIKQEGTDQPYPVEKFPIHRALQGEPAYADDVEVANGDHRIPLEFWASPVKDEQGNVESALVAFQDISQRKQEEAELAGYRNQLEGLVKKRTDQLNEVNEKLLVRLDWLSKVNKVYQTVTGADSLEEAYQDLTVTILRILQAKLVFILHWDRDEMHAGAFACSLGTGKPHDKKSLQELFLEESPLRREIERGKLITCPPEQTGALSECFPDQEIPSLILAPVMIGPSVIGVLGVAIATASWKLLKEESDLVERMALDLATLAQGAMLLDQAVVLAAVEERNRLARELHDSVTQTLFTASVLAEATPRILEKDASLGRQNLSKLSLLIRGALAEMRSMLIELRLGDLHHQTLEQLLMTLVDGARARSQAVIHLSMLKDVPPLPEKVTIAFYRIAREALINATVHSGAEQIEVSLYKEEEHLVLSVQDNGCGFDPQAVPAGHLGLRIMTERAQEIGAALQFQSAPDKGTVVRFVWKDPEGKGMQDE